jgi:hypothetical protein
MAKAIGASRLCATALSRCAGVDSLKEETAGSEDWAFRRLGPGDDPSASQHPDIPFKNPPRPLVSALVSREETLSSRGQRLHECQKRALIAIITPMIV